MKDKRFRIALLIFIAVVLLALPTFSEVYYPALYYGLILCLVPISVYKVVKEERIKQNFYQKWQSRRKQGLVINMAREGLRTILAIITVVGLSQFVINGRTPAEIMSKLSGSQLAWILAILIFFGLIGGIAAYYENEKKYTCHCREAIR